jgi:hypothetical protein
MSKIPGRVDFTGHARQIDATRLTVGVCLALLWVRVGWAIAPAPPLPCPKSFASESVARLVAQVREAANSDAKATWAADCASNVLRGKGEEVIPALISLMNTRQGAVQFAALGAVCGEGRSGASAVPYLVKRLSGYDPSFALQGYRTLGCIGQGAVPAIPFLLRKSVQTIPGFPTSEGDEAIQALGKLANYDPDRIIPHLTRLVDIPAHTVAAANALCDIGARARPAVPMLHRRLTAVLATREDYGAGALIGAIAALGNPRDTVPFLIGLIGQPGASEPAAGALRRLGPRAKAAVPRLISRLHDPDLGWRERDEDVIALASIDARSPAVLKAMLAEVTSPRSALATMYAATALASVDPLPSDFADTLIQDIESPDDGERYELTQALEHTHTGRKAGPSRPAPPTEVIDGALIEGLVSLTRQPHAITFKDVERELRIKPPDYEIEGSGNSYELRARWSAAHEQRTADPIAYLSQSDVIQGPDFSARFPGAQPWPDTQELRISLSRDVCVSAEAVQPHAAGFTSIAVAGFRIKGNAEKDKSVAMESTLYIDRRCPRSLRIEKHFDPGYWSYVCPFSYTQDLIETHILPALREKFGPGFEAFDLQNPQIKASGPGVQLIYALRKTSPGARADPQPSLRLEVSRCTREVGKVWEY